ncbi:MAG: hypothetical protein AVDCRST_MAG43-772 [uncultured Thermomicrobiales bacterium]|uniref:Transposase IS4-like domain-containing protein n=1 Tax=uncultured Thermomicrobiales bacterium TaxID=1645740 RepID=A0A6J4UHG5_9BACT|nr:MAG: hypothetical protein AVDCRST_MAG43-772 [uncultured Thermomicrobiales bacterium]
MADSTDRGTPGRKRHLIGDLHGIPLASLLTGGNRHDSIAFEELVDAVPPVTQPSGKRRKRPAKPHAD